MQKNSSTYIPFTSEAYQKLLDRRKFLLEEKKAVILRLSEAREQGDLSENGAYKYAKFELGNIRRELSKLNYLIKNGQVKIGSKESNIADFGKTVTVSNQDSLLSFMIVSKYESNPAEKKISADSPLGKALIGKSIGSEVVVNSPKGSIKYTITDIS